MSAFDFSVKPVEAMRNELDKLTILRFLLDTPPVSHLVNLMNELLAEDAMPYDIAWAYHDFAAAVLASHPPQVTGDRWRDCLIFQVLERENAFSLACAKGQGDEALLRAFARDLAIVQQLFLLDDSMIKIWCTSSQGGQDLAGWANFTGVAFFIVEGEGPLPTMRRMLLSSENWSPLARPLMEMHAQFGCGATLGHRFMEFDGETLAGVKKVRQASEEAEEELTRLLERHAQGENPGALYVTSEQGMARVRAALQKAALPAVRLRDIVFYPALCERLGGTALRCAVVLPMPHPVEPLLCDLLGEGMAEPPENILPITLCPVNDPMLAGRFSHVL